MDDLCGCMQTWDCKVCSDLDPTQNVLNVCLIIKCIYYVHKYLQLCNIMTLVFKPKNNNSLNNCFSKTCFILEEPIVKLKLIFIFNR